MAFAADALAQYLCENGGRYFPEFRGLPLTARLIDKRHHRHSLIYEVDLEAKSGSHALIVKVQLGPRLEGRYVKNRGTQLSERPRLRPRIDPKTIVRLQYAVLSATHQHFARLRDQRIGAIRVLDVYNDGQALIMAKSPGLSLYKMIGQHTRIGRLNQGDELDEALTNAGTWLKAYHDNPNIPALEATGLPQPRRATPDALLASIREYADFLIEEHGLERRVRQLCAAAESAARRFLSGTAPLCTGYGDYSPRNILVGSGARVAAIDPMALSRIPVYEDVAYFLCSLKLRPPHGYLTRDLLFSPKQLSQYELAFLRGYFPREAPPLAVIRLFEIQILLDFWASAVNSYRKAIGVWRAAKRCRLAFQDRYFHRYADDLLRELDDFLVGADGAFVQQTDCSAG